MARLDGKIAVITGAASGIGLATTRLFVAEGADVVLVDNNRSDLAKAAQFNDRALDTVHADTTKIDDLNAVREHIASRFGKIDVVFANAGVAAFEPFGKVTEEVFDRVSTVNFKGTYFTVQTLLPVLKDGASVILTASVSGFKGQPAFSVYAATKAAIRSLARTLTTDLAARRIRVNAISPGNIETPIAAHGGMPDADAKRFFEQTAGETPLGRNGQSEDIAAAALYLASADSAYVTASEIVVDGGYAQV